VVQSYGLTEACSQVATLAPADALRKLESAGRPLFATELRIDVSTNDQAAEVSYEEQDVTNAATQPAVRRPDDAPVEAVSANCGMATMEHAVGEILVRGPTVTPGYLAPDEEGSIRGATDAEGWLHTGDLGYLDQEGYLYVLDRRADLIISGGENVYPAEVEAVLLAHPAVAEAGVFGIPDPVWGRRVAAAIVTRPGMVVDEADLIAFCRARLATYKVPIRVELREALPRNAAGKLLGRKLAHSPAEPAPPE
jgi:O-succinylbenzoic acid--CoA ligase